MDKDFKFWKSCSSCKKEIGFSKMYYVCSVSTCKHPRKGFSFCSVPCWDAHLGFANHRESWAEEQMSPSLEGYLRELDNSPEEPSRPPMRKIIGREIVGPSTSTSPHASNLSIGSADSELGKDYKKTSNNIETDTLIVVSKVKQLISNQSGFNTSQCCVDALTKKVIEESLKAIANAEKAGRKTVMGRDVD